MHGANVVDLHAFSDARYEARFDLDSLLISDFFTMDEVVEGGYTGERTVVRRVVCNVAGGHMGAR